MHGPSMKIQMPSRHVFPIAALCLSVCSILRTAAAPTTGGQHETVVAFTNGQWFDGQSFRPMTGCAAGGTLRFPCPSRVDKTIDLHGGYVIPPFGEAHNHNVETLNNIDKLVATYLRHGIFYVKNPNSLARDREPLAAKLNRLDSIDVAFSNGSFTASGGHPVEIPDRVIGTGKWSAADAEGGFYYTVDNETELEKKWPILLGTHPDFIKTYLLYSDEYARRRDDPKFFAWKGLDPGLLPAIVKNAHAARLRVSTHIENEADFRAALVAGVDEINHMPGFRAFSDVDRHPLSSFEVSDADAALAARQGTYVVTTLNGARALTGEQRRDQDTLNTKNLQTLLGHHVRLALGSDSYREDTLPEALYISGLHAMSNAALLDIWTRGTARTIFPNRKIGELKAGDDANFLVLKSNPLDDFGAVQDIALEVKQGVVLDIPAVTPSAGVAKSGNVPAQSTRTLDSPFYGDLTPCVGIRGFSGSVLVAQHGTFVHAKGTGRRIT
jgi:hypothetical protein